ncbi:hypothetical protein FB2170_08649 [Maribacter sp. HTCC2170]|nr:hypothetical protein FB2170_08649 [Maribacter sp. HTCC2170]
MRLIKRAKEFLCGFLYLKTDALKRMIINSLKKTIDIPKLRLYFLLPYTLN